MQDLQQLTQIGAAPVLNLIQCYARDDELDFIATDVYSYHVDRSPIATDTFLCTYHGAASDILPNAQVQQKILIPSIREQLRALYDGPEAGFEQFLTEYFLICIISLYPMPSRSIWDEVTYGVWLLIILLSKLRLVCIVRRLNKKVNIVYCSFVNKNTAGGRYLDQIVY